MTDAHKGKRRHTGSVMHVARVMLPPLALILVASAGCGPAPGKGPTAKLGYERSQPVIDALEAFRAENARYPEKTEELVPGFLPEIPPGAQPSYPLSYRKQGEGYTLMFRYEKPGMNYCEYTPTSKWSCHGYY